MMIGYVATGIDDHQKLFQSGKAGFLFGGTWAVGVMESTDGLNFNVQSFPQRSLMRITAGQIPHLHPSGKW